MSYQLTGDSPEARLADMFSPLRAVRWRKEDSCVGWFGRARYDITLVGPDFHAITAKYIEESKRPGRWRGHRGRCAAPPRRSFLVAAVRQDSFAARFHVVGYSVAGEETVVQVPELNVCFDIGRCPFFALTSDICALRTGTWITWRGCRITCRSGISRASRRERCCLPRPLAPYVDQMLRRWRDIERQATPYTLVPMNPGDVHEVRARFRHPCGRDASRAGQPGISCLVSRTGQAQARILGTPGPELAAMRKSGVQIQYRIEVPLVAYLGDTTAGAGLRSSRHSDRPRC